MGSKAEGMAGGKAGSDRLTGCMRLARAPRFRLPAWLDNRWNATMRKYRLRLAGGSGNGWESDPSSSRQTELLKFFGRLPTGPLSKGRAGDQRPPLPEEGGTPIVPAEPGISPPAVEPPTNGAGA